MNWRRLAPLTGVVAFGLMVAAFAIGGESPDVDATGQEVIDFYNNNSGEQTAAVILFGYGILFFTFFLGVLRSMLRKAEGETGGLSALAFGGGILAVMGMASFAGFAVILVDQADAANLDPAAAQVLNMLSNDFFIGLAIGMCVLMLASGISIVKNRSLPVWLGWVAIVLGIASATPAGFFALLAALVWILIVSLILYARGGSEAAPTIS